MIKQLFFTKSFCCVGDSLNKCFDCSYCRLHGSEKLAYNIIPSEISPVFKKIPVAVNLFYGDPLLQINNTLSYLEKLEKAEHAGTVIIITKGDFSKFPKHKFNLDLHFAFSTFGIDSKYDGGNIRTFENNLKIASESEYKYSTEYRPVIKDINDTHEIVENVYKIANEYNSTIGFCGLQVNDNLKQYLTENNINFAPYNGYEFGLKKAVSKNVEDLFYNFSEQYNVPTFRKTSCLLSYVHGLDRDYNAHYYRPNEMRCEKCVMRNKCLSFKGSMTNNKVNIPFEHEVITKEKHECLLHKKGICKFANNDCKNINGKLVKINQKITSSDLRLIKWLTGYTVDCDFDEIEFISDNWFNFKG